MLIFFKERVAYLAVPKTGTSAIERALHRKASAVFRDPPGIKHTNAMGYERKFRKVFDRKNLAPMQTVAVIREPVSWLGSWYRYRHRPALSGHKNSTEGKSFDEFVAAYLSVVPPGFAKIGAQSRFLCDRSGEVLVSHLFPYENMTLFLSFMSARLDHQIALDRVNASPEQDLVLSSSLHEELRNRYTRDFELHAQITKAPLLS